MSQTDLSDEVRLYLIDPEADHEVGDDVLLLLGLAYDLDGFVDIQQDLLQSLQQVEPGKLSVELVLRPSGDAFAAEGDPLEQDVPGAEQFRYAVYQQREVAGESVLQRSELEQFPHEGIRIDSPLEVDGYLEAVLVRLITNIRDLLDLSALDQFDDLVHYGFHRCGRRDLGHLYAAAVFVILVF